MTDKEIVQALRCTSTPGGPTGDCEKCPYWKTEQLTAERDALREKKRWISVTEKTPEYDMPQLALNADGDALIANYAYGEWFDTWGQDVEVTHWMPLPGAPEEGEKA